MIAALVVEGTVVVTKPFGWSILTWKVSPLSLNPPPVRMDLPSLILYSGKPFDPLDPVATNAYGAVSYTHLTLPTILRV